MTLLTRSERTVKAAVPGASFDWSRAILAMVLIGSVCRIAQYLADASYWHDEALVVLNVMDKTAAQLPKGLDYDQAAPPLFLMAERGLLLLFGSSEYSLRLPSLLCGLAALAIFALLCRRVFPGPIAFCITAFFAFSDKLIWHSAEVKPYSGDAFCAVLLLYVALAFRSRGSSSDEDRYEIESDAAASRSRPLPASLRANNDLAPTQRLVLLAILATVLVWFSFPAAIVFGGLSLMLLPEILRREPRELAIYLAANSLVLVSFLVLYRYSIKPQHSVYLSTFWARDFPPYNKPLRIPLWLASEIYSLCDHPYRSFGPLFLLLAGAGVWELLRARHTRLLAACLLPVLLAVVAACFKQYPFNGDRVTIYLVPALFLLSGGGLMLLRNSLATPGPVDPDPGPQDPAWSALRMPKSFLRMAWLILAGIVIGRGVVEAAHRLADPRSRSGVRPVVEYLRGHRQPGEGIYLVGEVPDPKTGEFTSKLCLEPLCYWHAPPGPVHRGLPAVTARVTERRFWVIFASLPHTATRAAAPLVNQLRPVATEVSRYIPRDGGGAVLLFEKRDEGASQ